jgi:hypothetical protein
MAIIVQDFVVSNTADFTGKALVDGADHNNLVNEAIPASDANSSKGLIVTSRDGVGDVPDVPDVALYAKYAGYIWVRRLLDDTFKMYVWVPSIAPDPVFDNWVDTAADLSGILTDISAVQADITALYALVAAAQARANSAYDLATDALAKAETAETDAANAVAVATAAQTRADDAYDLATLANTNLTAFIARFKLYDSGLIDLILGTEILNIAHNLGGYPTVFKATLVCIANDAEYIAGDEYPITYFASGNAGVVNTDAIQPKTWINLAFSTTNVKAHITGGNIRATSSVTGVTGDIDITKWKLRIYAQRFV